MGRQVSSFGTDSVVNKTITTAYTANSGERLFVNATGGGFNITLPASPNDGDTIQVLDVAGVFSINNVTLLRNGLKIQNLAEDMTLNLSNAAVTLIYSGATFGWVFIGP
jgi:hypothetical protein